MLGVSINKNVRTRGTRETNQTPKKDIWHKQPLCPASALSHTKKETFMRNDLFNTTFGIEGIETGCQIFHTRSHDTQAHKLSKESSSRITIHSFNEIVK